MVVETQAVENVVDEEPLHSQPERIPFNDVSSVLLQE